MNKHLFFILLLCTVLTGCGKEIQYITEYKEVRIPVNPEINISAPIRPSLKTDESYADYLLRVITYTEDLEVILKNILDTYGIKK